MRGRSPNDFLRLDVTGHPALSSDLGLVPDRKVARHPRLGGHGDVPSQLCRPCDAGQGNDQTILPNFHVVGNLNQIIQLGTVTNECVAQCPTVNRGIGTNLHIIANLHTPQLRYFNPDPIIIGQTKTVTAYLLTDTSQWHGINTQEELKLAGDKLNNKIHIMGIAGAGASSIAGIAKTYGFDVSDVYGKYVFLKDFLS